MHYATGADIGVVQGPVICGIGMFPREGEKHIPQARIATRDLNSSIARKCESGRTSLLK
jgi:hypothetical protein